MAIYELDGQAPELSPEGCWVAETAVVIGRVRLKPTITHVLSGIDSVPQAFEITANKGRFKAINPAQVMMKV